MFYIDIIADGERAVDPVSVEFEDDAWEEFSGMERGAVYMSEDCDMEFSVRMYDDNDNIIAGTVYVDGERIA